MDGPVTARGFAERDVGVRGGTMRVGVWEASTGDPESAPTVLAVHGISASHRAFLAVVRALPEMRVMAPDLRGRGRSADLPGPWGMVSHAEDLAAVLDQCADGPVVVLGHSMGGFVAVTLAARHPARVRSLVLVDGGVPLVVPPGTTREEYLTATLAPVAGRLSRVFVDRQESRRFWQQHPAFVAHYSPDIEDYADYDVVGVEPELRPAARIDAITQDAGELIGDGPVAQAWRSGLPRVHFLRAPRGLLDEPGGFYPEQDLTEFAGRAGFVVEQTPENHYSLLMGDAGAALVARAVRAAVAG